MQKEIKTYTEHRPWGSFTRFVENEKVTVKIIRVNAGEELSLQSHRLRDEFWRVLKGNPEITIKKGAIDAVEGEEFFIKRREPHRIGAPNGEVEILEISLGEFDENDIRRFEDRYGRS